MATDPPGGPALARQIAATNPPAGTLALWWLGQAGFAIRGAGLTLLVDPFLGPHPGRLIPPAIQPADFAGVDAIFCTHEHLDHLDPATLAGVAAASPAARIVVPRPIAPRLEALGIARQRIVGAQPVPEEPPLQLGALRVSPVPARHGTTSPPPAYDFGLQEPGSNGLYRYLGDVFALNGVHVYHAGDTIAYAGMAERLARVGVDVALLPINGRSFAREQADIIGNLSAREAADLAAAAGADLAIPMHFELFAANREHPGAFADYAHAAYPFLAIHLLGRHRPFLYARPAGPRRES